MVIDPNEFELIQSNVHTGGDLGGSGSLLLNRRTGEYVLYSHGRIHPVSQDQAGHIHRAIKRNYQFRPLPPALADEG